jgi:phasin family protein
MAKKSIEMQPAEAKAAAPAGEAVRFEPAAEPATETSVVAFEPKAEPVKVAPAAVSSMPGKDAGFGKFQAEVKSKMENTMKTAEDMFSFGQGNLEAFVKSGQIWVAGVQDLSKSIAATAQGQMDAAMATLKALSGVKSLKDAVELQTTLARSSVETAMAETGKLTDASLKLAEQTLAPITARVTLAVEKFGSVEKFGRAA